MTAMYMQRKDDFIKMCEFLANNTDFLMHKKPLHSAEAFFWVLPTFIPVDFSKPTAKKETRLQILFIAEHESGCWLGPEQDERKYRWVFNRAEYVKLPNV